MIWSALAAALWGGLYVVSQLAFQSHFPPATLSAARLLVGVAALLLALRRLPVLWERRLALLGALIAATVLVQSFGTYLSGGATGSLLTLMTPPFVAILAPYALGERTRPSQWAGIALGIGGAALVIGPAGAGSPFGDVLLVSASLFWALFTVLGARLVRSRGSLQVTTAACVWALPILVVASALELALGAEIRLSGAVLLDIVYLGLGATALGWWAWYRGVERLPAVTASVFFLAQPVVGIALSIPIFHFPLTLGFAAGSILVVLGMLLAT